VGGYQLLRQACDEEFGHRLDEMLSDLSDEVLCDPLRFLLPLIVSCVFRYRSESLFPKPVVIPLLQLQHTFHAPNY
jgi:hypothetical protein